MKHSFTIFLLFFSCIVIAQPYVEGGKTRHRFAQLNVGLDVRTFLSTGSETSFIDSSGLITNSPLKNHTETRLIIGGTHFWGHADFYIAFAVAAFGKSGFTTGVETGAKFFPWRIEHKKIRPYLGMAWLTTGYQQGDGANLVRNKYPLTAGLVYNIKNHLLEINAGYNYNNINSYYVNTGTSVPVKTQPFWISLGYKFMIETTVSAEKNWLNGKTKQLTDTLAADGKLNGFTLAIGPSSSFFLKKSSHNESVARFMDHHKIAAIFPEFGIGYYLHKPDLQFNMAYRSVSSGIGAYGYAQAINRKSLAFEVYHFFADYHGFVPFAGIALSKEWLKVKETNQLDEVERESFTGVEPGLIFGWDIRPNRIQAWYLRTNLRWFPNLNVKMNSGKNVSFDQLEFNFIQLVVFPGRMF